MGSFSYLIDHHLFGKLSMANPQHFFALIWITLPFTTTVI